MRISNILLIGSLLYTLVSCNGGNRDNESSTDAIRQLNTSDTFYFEFPFTQLKHRVDSSYYYAKLGFDSLAGIKPIMKGVDSVEIRISVFYSALDNLSNLIILKNQNKEWQAEFCVLKEIWDTVNSKIIDVERTCIRKTPLSGWKSLIQDLFKLELLTLPDDSKLPILSTSSDAGAVVVEVATKKYYRAYSYTAPYYTQLNHWQARNLCSLVKLLEKELEFKPLYEYSFDYNDSLYKTEK